MDIQLMREFIALVNLKSYRKVAQQFHIAPSTLSRHIKAIGKELGHPLFENLRAYQLTDEGQVVFERFGILVGEYDGLLQALAAQGPHYVRTAYCFEDRAISHYVRAAKEKFERAHRRTRVKIISPQDKTISACLESGEADLSVMYAPPAANARRFKTQLLIPEPLLAAVPKGTLEHREGPLPLEALEGRTFYYSAHPGYLDYSHHILDCIESSDVSMSFRAVASDNIDEMYSCDGPDRVWFSRNQAFRPEIALCSSVLTKQAICLKWILKISMAIGISFLFPTEPTKSPFALQPISLKYRQGILMKMPADRHFLVAIEQLLENSYYRNRRY